MPLSVQYQQLLQQPQQYQQYYQQQIHQQFSQHNQQQLLSTSEAGYVMLGLNQVESNSQATSTSLYSPKISRNSSSSGSNYTVSSATMPNSGYSSSISNPMVHSSLTSPKVKEATTLYPSQERCNCKSNPNRIPRPRNAFILFRQKHHQSVLEESTEAKTNPEVSRELGRRWRALSTEDRDYWKNLAEEEKKNHAKRYPNYRYTPRRGGKNRNCPVCRPNGNLSQSQTHYSANKPDMTKIHGATPQLQMYSFTQPGFASLSPSLQQQTSPQLNHLQQLQAHLPLHQTQSILGLQSMYPYPQMGQYGYSDQQYGQQPAQIYQQVMAPDKNTFSVTGEHSIQYAGYEQQQHQTSPQSEPSQHQQRHGSLTLSSVPLNFYSSYDGYSLH